jgi:hypothetical protein
MTAATPLIEARLRDADDWIQQQRAFWERQLDALDKYLHKKKAVCANTSQSNPDAPSGSSGASKPRAKKSSARGRKRKS